MGRGWGERGYLVGVIGSGLIIYRGVCCLYETNPVSPKIITPLSGTCLTRALPRGKSLTARASTVKVVNRSLLIKPC